MFGSGVVLLSILASLVVSQGSFNLGAFAPAPSTIQQTYLFWAVSTLIFILTVTLGFMLFRTVVKLYIERQTNRQQMIDAKTWIDAQHGQHGVGAGAAGGRQDKIAWPNATGVITYRFSEQIWPVIAVAISQVVDSVLEGRA